jgi:ribosome-binding factor A
MVPRNSCIKKRRREGLIARELALPLQRAFDEQAETRGFYISRVELSDGAGLCTIFLARLVENGDVGAAMRAIKLFAPSTRTALAKLLNGRYVPDILFVFDKHVDKVRELNTVLSRVSQELKDQAGDKEQALEEK